MNHHKRLSKWRRPIKFWRAVFTQKRWDRFYPPRLSHFTRQRPVGCYPRVSWEGHWGNSYRWHFRCIIITVFQCSYSLYVLEIILQWNKRTKAAQLKGEVLKSLMTWRDVSVQLLSRTSLLCALSASPSAENRHTELSMMHILHSTMFVTFAAAVSSLLLVFPTAPSITHSPVFICGLVLRCTGFECIFNLGHRIQTSTSVYFYSQMMFYSTHSCSAFPFCTCQNKSPSTYQPF